MFGYATRETDELMPLPILLAHRLTKRLAEVRKADVLPYLRPDGKSQVTVRYEVDEHGIQRPVEIERVLISTQHRDGLDVETLLKPDLLEHVVEPILHADVRGLFDPARLGAKDFLYVNPTGKFVIGGPMGDTGADGPEDRRRHVRRRCAARRRRLLGQGPDEGRPLGRLRRPLRRQERRRRGPRRPLPAPGRLRDRRRAPDERERRLLRDRDRPALDDRAPRLASTSTCGPGAIIRDLDLLRPIYAKTAAYGHFGRDDRDFTWERTDKAEALRAAAGLLAETRGLGRRRPAVRAFAWRAIFGEGKRCASPWNRVRVRRA